MKTERKDLKFALLKQQISLQDFFKIYFEAYLNVAFYNRPIARTKEGLKILEMMANINEDSSQLIIAIQYIENQKILCSNKLVRGFKRKIKKVETLQSKWNTEREKILKP